MADFVSFNEFVDRLDKAKAENYLDSAWSHQQFAIGAAAGGLAGALSATAEQLPPPAELLPPPKEVVEPFEEEFEKMKKYLIGRYKHISRSWHTFMDRNGNFVDCVPFNELPTVRAAKKAGIKVVDKAPDPTRDVTPVRAARKGGGTSRFLPAPVMPPLLRGQRDQFGHPVDCPEGMVPLPRTTLSHMARCWTFDRYFQKFPVPVVAKTRRKTATRSAVKGKGSRSKKTSSKSRGPVPPAFGQPQDGRHLYARCQVTSPKGPYYGCSTGLNLWRPVAPPGAMSLSQLWMVGDQLQTAKGPQYQTVESGWIVYPDFPPSGGLGDDPVLWVFFNPDGYGDRAGYMENRRHEGFIQFPDTGWVFMAGGHLPLSTRGGNQFAVQMLWQLQDNDKDGNGRGWYLYLGTNLGDVHKVGYIPIQYYESTMLADSAQQVAYGGEVGPDYQYGPPYAGEMGSGQRPRATLSECFGDVAFQQQMYVLTDSSEDGVYNPIPLTGLWPDVVDDPPYDLKLFTASDGNVFMFFGGPPTP